ncbi:phosphoethanolamine transferase [uncultured Tolumonas sp.]|uniref:phosphoethanolamine transferase n=1 Tax=uncultured Tolumonas sp. TaxID=263765 RepID=UPI003747A213
MRFQLKSQYLTLLLASYFTLILNYPFFRESWKVLNSIENVKTGFIISIPLFVLFALNILFSLFTIKYLSKPIFIALVLTSSLVAYAGLTYGTVFDYGMIKNSAQTNMSEASSYLNPSLIICFLLTGIIPAFLIARTKIIYRPLLKEVLTKFAVISLSLLGLLIIAFFYYQDYASVGRNNKFLQKYIVPTQYTWSGYKYVKETYFTTPLVYQQLGLDAKKNVPPTVTKPQMTVMVLGETARAMNYQYNGYSRDTNRFTAPDGLISFRHVSSCGTATAVSVPCMFSFMGRKNYDESRAETQDNVLDVIHRAGLNVQWIDNDSGCKGVCARVPTLNIDIKTKSPLCDGTYCFDEIMLPELKRLLAEAKGKDTLIALHLIGSHGPTYYRRYPASHRIFTPDCERSDIQNCSHDELVNTYDNTIAYTDYMLSQVIALLKANSSEYNTSMLYMSDHGESLGEKGLYLHGTPYALAPEEQTHVPGLLWLSDNYAKEKQIDTDCLRKEAQSKQVSQDYLSHSLLSLTGVATSTYKPELDLISGCRRNS